MVNIRGVEPSDVGSEQFGAWGGVTNPPPHTHTLTHSHTHTHFSSSPTETIITPSLHSKNPRSKHPSTTVAYEGETLY